MLDHEKVIPSGIEQLDTLLGGGLPARQCLVISGDPGSGKTILCSQIAFAQAARGRHVVLATVTSEPHDKLVGELQGFSFFNSARIGEEIFLLSIYPWLQKGPKEAKDMLLKVVRERKASLLFIDGLRALRDLWQDERRLRDFLYELNVGLSQSDAIGLFTTEYPVDKLIEYPEATTVDGVVGLSLQRRQGRHVARRIEVRKLRGRPHLLGEHTIHLTSHGVKIIPRLEAVVRPNYEFQPTGKRAAFGHPELDKLLHGGLPCASTTLLVGGTGIGKTLLALHFAAQGAASGERSLFLTYSEPVGRLIQRAADIGLDVRPAIASGNLKLVYRSTVEVEADDLIDDMLRLLGDKNGRLVLDGLGELEEAIWEPTRMRDFLGALIIKLRDLGTTSLFIRELGQLTGPIDFGDTPIAVTSENLIFMRHVEARSKIHRVMSILKMRESDFDSTLREFVIASDGLKVLAPVESIEGVLSGQARPMTAAKPG